MNDNQTIWVFTPSRTTPENLEFILVQRHKLIQDAVERVEESALTGHRHHLLFVGPRGCGKTHLVTVLVNRIGAREKLADRLRIAWLNEDETSTSLLDLLIRIFGALEKRYGSEFDAGKLASAYELDGKEALDFVSRQLLACLGSRTLLVVTENLDAIFDGLGIAGQQQLRAFIQENPKLCIVATAQRLVEDLSDRTSPFFGFFQTEHLKPLKVDEATALLQNIARLQQRAEVVAFLATNRGRSRVQAIHHLSGGNHRIYIVLSQFITRDSVDALVGPFMKMVDELTPYYQERIRWLPPLQRKIVEYLCSCEGTVPVSQIARRLFATPQTISSQLQDLREKGYVEANKRGRESLYEISEPLMRLCVEVKDNQRLQPLRLLVDFLRVWYDDRDLKNQLGQVHPQSVACAYFSTALERNKVEGNLRRRVLLEEVQSSFPEEFPSQVREDVCHQLEDAPEPLLLAMQKRSEKKQFEVMRVLNDAILEESSDPESKADLLLYRARKYADKETAVADYTAVIEMPGAPVELIAKALFRRGVRYGRAGDLQKEIADYTAVIEMPGTPAEQVAEALFSRGVSHGRAGDLQKAIADYTAVIEMLGAPAEQVAMALVNRGVRYGRAGDLQKEIADYTAVIEMSGAPTEQVAKARINRGVSHGQAGDLQKEIADYTAVIEMPGAPAEQVGKALVFRAEILRQTGQKQDALSDLEAVVRLSECPPYITAIAHCDLAELHFGEGRWSEGFHALEASLDMHAKVQPAHRITATDLIGVLFSAGLNPEGRSEKVAELLRLFRQYEAMPILGEGLIQHIGHVFKRGAPFPSTDNLEGWASTWEHAAEGIPDFSLSVRLLRTATDFIKAGGKDQGILLSLLSAERAILKQALGLANDADTKAGGSSI